MEYAEKSDVIEAMQYLGSVNIPHIRKWLKRNKASKSLICKTKKGYCIKTPKGEYDLTDGDYIVKEQGKFYACKQDEFERMYEEVEENG